MSLYLPCLLPSEVFFGWQSFLKFIKSCLGMTSQSYERLNSTVSWYCPKCESTNVLTTFFQEWFLDIRNSFAVLDKSVQSIDPVFTPTIHSTYCQTRVKRVVRAPRRQSTRLSDVFSSRSKPVRFPCIFPSLNVHDRTQRKQFPNTDSVCEWYT